MLIIEQVKSLRPSLLQKYFNMKYPHFFFKTTLLIFMSWVITGCQKDLIIDLPQTADQHKAFVATQWFNQLYIITKVSPGFTPPVASRASGYAGIALYESVVTGMTTYQSLGSKLNGLPKMPLTVPGKNYYWPACANAAMAYMTRNLYANMPSDQFIIVNNLENQIAQSFSSFADAETLSRSKAFGIAIGEVVFNWSVGDGGHEGYNKNFPESYSLIKGPGKWVPTAPAYQRALQPYWGNNREFMPGIINKSKIASPLPYSTSNISPFFSQGLEVYTVTKTLTEEQKMIAFYWSDDPGIGGTPPGHSISIATQILTKEDASLAIAAETYCKIGIAIADAFITCWKTKYESNLLRPITYIRETIDSTWTPILTTPPFPEFTSGHSVQSYRTGT